MLVALHFRPADVLPLQLHPTRSDRPPRRSGMEAAAAASSLFVAEAGSKQASSQLAHWLSKTEGASKQAAALSTCASSLAVAEAGSKQAAS